MDEEEPIRIPLDSLSPEALHGVIESFVLREGTEYGPAEFSLAEKAQQVAGQLAQGLAEIWYDPASQSVTIVPAGSQAPADVRPRHAAQ